MEIDNRVIVIGASAGGVEAFLRIAARLSPNLPAPVLIVLHIGAHRSHLPELLNRSGPNHAVLAQTGMQPVAGMIYVAPPDQHLLLDGGLLRLIRGPKENHARPAINPLFRSAALDKGARVVGVVLTGMLDDGAAGLRAIKACGGIALVQDPEEAAEPSMPRSALASTAVDHVLRLDAMTDLLNSLAQPLENAPATNAPEWLRIEHAVSLGNANMQDLDAIGVPSKFTCPECGGALFEVKEGKPLRFLCHTGHAFSLRGLASLQENVTDETLWSALRALQEKEAILRRLAQVQASETPGSESATFAEAEKLAQFIVGMRAIVRSAPPSGPVDGSESMPEKPGVER